MRSLHIHEQLIGKDLLSKPIHLHSIQAVLGNVHQSVLSQGPFYLLVQSLIYVRKAAHTVFKYGEEVWQVSNWMCMTLWHDE